MEGRPVETRLSLEDIGEPEEEYPLWSSGVFPQTEVEMESVGQAEDSGSESAHSDARPLVQDRDPRGINKCLKVTFVDVIAEPSSVRSFDKVWLWSHALFEVSRLWFYRLFSLLLAVPVSLVAGILFAVLSCLHIWLIMPCVQICLINMHWVQTVWGSVLNIAIGPLFKSMGKCFGGVNIRLARD